MLISSEFLIFAITIMAAAAVGLCYLPIVRDVSAFIIKQRQQKLPTKQLEQKLLTSHQEALKRIEEKTERTLAEQLTALSGKHSEALSKLEIAIKSDYEKNRQELKAVSIHYLDETKIALGGLVERAEKRVNDELTKQLETTRAELENYKKRQLQKIDDEIATLVEKTIYKTLGKGLSLADQIDIIYEALAEAKEEGFFGKNAN